MNSMNNEAMLIDDREDLITVLQMRFGSLPEEMIHQIYEIGDYHILQRLILAAANAANWDVFLEEFKAGEDSFRLLGEDFNPLGDFLKGRGGSSGEEKK
jgi:hypothetical protein